MCCLFLFSYYSQSEVLTMKNTFFKPFQERFTWHPFETKWKNLKEEWIIATFWGYLKRRFGRNIVWSDKVDWDFNLIWLGFGSLFSLLIVFILILCMRKKITPKLPCIGNCISLLFWFILGFSPDPLFEKVVWYDNDDRRSPASEILERSWIYII